MSFAGDIEAFKLKVNKLEDNLLRAVIIEMGNQIIGKSPVGNPELWKTKKPPKDYIGGRFRANWQHSSSRPASSSINSVDSTGETTKASLLSSVENVKAGGVEYLTNNLVYAIPLEYGHSTQAPDGTVRITVAQFNEILNSKVTDLE